MAKRRKSGISASTSVDMSTMWWSELERLALAMAAVADLIYTHENDIDACEIAAGAAETAEYCRMRK